MKESSVDQNNVKRVGSMCRGEFLVVELKDGTRLYYAQYIPYGGGGHLAWGPGWNPPTQMISTREEWSQLRASIWDGKCLGKRLTAMKPDEKAFFAQKKAEAKEALTTKIAERTSGILMTVKFATWEEFPGGKFLRIRLNKNIEGSYLWGRKGLWDVSNPIHTPSKLLILVGVSVKTMAQVFSYKEKLWTRAYRHVVQGKKISSYKFASYRLHTMTYTHNGGASIVLKPFEGEYKQYKLTQGE